MDKAKAGSCARFKRALINGIDRWSPVVPHPQINPFSFLVCSLSHSLPPPECTSCYAPNRSFFSWQTISFTRGFSGKSIFSSAYLLLFPFISCLFSIHIRGIHPLARPFACFVICADGANVRKCTLSLVYATHYLPPGYLPCIRHLVFPYSDLGPAINSKQNLTLRTAGVLLNGWGMYYDISLLETSSSSDPCLATGLVYCLGQTPLSPVGCRGQALCLYSCMNGEALWFAFIRLR